MNNNNKKIPKEKPVIVQLSCVNLTVSKKNPGSTTMTKVDRLQIMKLQDGCLILVSALVIIV